MNHQVMAIYENGVLRPLVPLGLPEHTRVQVYVQPAAASLSNVDAHRQQVHEALIAAGLSLPLSEPSTVTSSLSAERREELARLFSTGRPLSELIIEEREGR
jgi:predicted DNA-binding antitoxin AbrB/MazE fold protein